MDAERVITEIVEILIEKLIPNPWNPNTQSNDVFNALVENIKEIGMVEPILVVPHEEKEGFYTIISGEHRYNACKVLNYIKVPAIIKEDFNIDLQKFQTVRMNVLKGKFDPVKFTQLFDEMAEKYGEDMTKEMMKFVDERAFKDVYMAIKRELPKDMQDKLESSRKEIKTVDDLSRILNELFSKYGNTLDNNFMLFTYGGKVHLWVLLDKDLKELLVDNIIEQFKDHGINADRFFQLLLERHGEALINEMVESGDGVFKGNLEDPEEVNFEK